MAMSYEVRHAVTTDMPRIEEIYADARRFMAEHGNPSQWGTTYPLREWLEIDIQENALYVITDSKGIHGVFFFEIGDDPTYAEIYDGAWMDNSPYGTIHRIAGDGSGGTLAAAVAFCRQCISHLRIDTHADNYVMQKAIVKQGFQKCGTIYVEDGTPRIAYEWVK